MTPSLSNAQKSQQAKTYNVTLRHVHVTIFAIEKQKVLYIACVCVYQCVCVCVCVCVCLSVWGYTALVILHANHTSHLLYYIHLWLTLLVFPHYLINSMIFGNKFIENRMCVSIFSTPFVWNIYHSKKNSTRYCHKFTLVLHVQYPFILSDCNEIWNFLHRVSYNPQISHFISYVLWTVHLYKIL